MNPPASAALTPSGLTTVTVTGPRRPPGVTAERSPMPSLRTSRAGTPPKRTWTAPSGEKPVPSRRTVVPPLLGPRGGDTEMSESGSTYRKAPTRSTAPTDGLVSRNVAGPPVPTGVTAVAVVPSGDTVTSTGLDTPLKRTPSPGSNPAPLSVTTVPPALGPWRGDQLDSDSRTAFPVNAVLNSAWYGAGMGEPVTASWIPDTVSRYRMGTLAVLSFSGPSGWNVAVAPTSSIVPATCAPCAEPSSCTSRTLWASIGATGRLNTTEICAPTGTPTSPSEGEVDCTSGNGSPTTSRAAVRAWGATTRTRESSARSLVPLARGRLTASIARGTEGSDRPISSAMANRSTAPNVEAAARCGPVATAVNPRPFVTDGTSAVILERESGSNEAAKTLDRPLPLLTSIRPVDRATATPLADAGGESIWATTGNPGAERSTTSVRA